MRVSIDGVIRHQALMQKGEVYQQEAKDGFEILIGDAGTFRYSINDRPGRSRRRLRRRDRRAHQPRHSRQVARARALSASSTAFLRPLLLAGFVDRDDLARREAQRFGHVAVRDQGFDVALVQA